MIKNCLQCNKEKNILPYRVKTFKFCSFECKYKSWEGHIPWNKEIKYTAEMKARLNMEGLKLGRGLSELKKGRHFSPLTEFKKGHSINKGDKSYLWKGGITPMNKLIRRSVEFRLWREAVFKRDNWTCQECNVRGRELHPHHIKAFSLWPELRFAIDNGLTLCKACHIKTDNFGGRVFKLGSVVAKG